MAGALAVRLRAALDARSTLPDESALGKMSEVLTASSGEDATIPAHGEAWEPAAVIRPHRVGVVVSAGVAVAVVLAFVIFNEPVSQWPGFAFGIVGVAAALAAAIPWGVFYLGRWLGFEQAHWRLLALALLVLLFAWFIWPTPYRDILAGQAHVNRLTGARCSAGQSCWSPSPGR